MKINKPYDPSDPYHALSRYVFLGLQKLSIPVEDYGEALKIKIDGENLKKLALPSEGTYILNFRHDSTPKDLINAMQNARQIHVNTYHPLVDHLKKFLNTTSVQVANFRFENQLDEEKLIEWFANSFKPLNLTIKEFVDQISCKR